MTNAAKCECEHADHFDNGPGHPYRKAPATGEVATEYGKFKVCGDCRDGSPSSAHGTKRTG